MPLYEYECEKCGTFEQIRKFSDPPLKKCPKCGKRIKKKLSAPAALQFKGTGWYVTDYAGKGKGKSKEGAQSKPEGKSTEASTEGKSESKSKGKSSSS